MKEELKEEIQLYLSENDKVSPCMIWDTGKVVLRGKIIAKTVLKKRLSRKNWII